MKTSTRVLLASAVGMAAAQIGSAISVVEAGWHQDNPGPIRREFARKGKTSHKQNARRSKKGGKR
jgi:hypothetical protein